MRTFLLLLIILLPSELLARNTGTTGALTFINLNQKLSTYSSLTYYHYDIFNFRRKKFQGEDFRAGNNQAYFQIAYNYQYFPWLSFTGGYIFQRAQPFEQEYFQNENRIFEQVTMTSRHRLFSSSHRFRFEQRFIDKRSEKATYTRSRLRYQVGAKIPLRGIVLDAGELYLNTYNEFYFSTTGERNAFFSDDWFYLGMGRQTGTLGSFEIGPLLQYSVINEVKDTRIHYTLMAGWSYSF